MRRGRKSLSSIAVPTIFNYSLAIRSKTTQTKVSCLSTHSFADSFDHTYSKHHTDKEAEDFSTTDVLQTKSHCGQVVSDGADHDYAAKVAELKSEKELIVDLEITVDEELAVIQEVTIKEEFKVEADVSGYEEITTVKEVERHMSNTDASMAGRPATTAVDHNYIVSKSPSTLRRQLVSVEEKLQSCRQKLKKEKAKTKRLLKTVNSLKKISCELNQKNNENMIRF